MTYSLARFRALKPAPPFRLGGTFSGDAGAASLGDAHGLLRLIGGAFSGLSDGDLIEVDVTALDTSGAHVARVTRLRSAGPGFRLPHRPRAAEFTAFTRAIRAYFVARGLSEVFTPTLVVCPGLEPSLEPFRVGDRFLPTSPEVSLKKALASGWTDIFDIKSVFRSGEVSPHHAPEFFMLEWYRAFADLDLIEDDLRGLLKSLGVSAKVETTDFRALFREYFAFDLAPGTTRDDLLTLATRLGVETAADDTFADVFNRVMVDRLEAELARRGPVIVRRFPPSMAALARLDREGWADRMEFYWNGLEIANAFNEVTDAGEQRRRWAEEASERARLKTSFVPEDPELISALEGGSPPAGGIALGVERLFMAITGETEIKALRLF